ncbi:hypothetical protein TCAL_00169 [Tigriopus californicus]|uniref:Uncharacterized protein n=1 Tax=Tigriopus californicus TaxID=6832 RepID=A0A553P4H0_TIGCA|nr:uncharacterized protein LOC131883168 [Tigriopus californicus]TRY72587.1 hypothetical protein TCAL_00169 [Tigriopus californicus]|eukprot:TCALIF_00169-PA protein Name:"Protein of unknown function" AED:0.00 eAED:0.00 QI:56/1/1/1/0.33/0.5/4/102/174
MPTMNTVLASVCFVLVGLVNSGWTLQWESADQGIPRNTYIHDVFGGPESFYFCRGMDATGHLRTGTMSKGQTACGLVGYESNIANYANSFEVLTISPGDKIGSKYHSRGDPIPQNAIPCMDFGTNQCFLGESVYNDGLCVEMPGKVYVDRERVLMNYKGQMKTCGSFFIMINDI